MRSELQGDAGARSSSPTRPALHRYLRRMCNLAPRTPGRMRQAAPHHAPGQLRPSELCDRGARGRGKATAASSG